MAWSYNNSVTPGVLTSTGGTEASPDSVTSGLSLVQSINGARAQVSIFGAWVQDVEIRAGGSFIRIDADLHLQLRGSAFINPQNGGVIHGFRSVVRFNTNANRTDNACTFATGSSFICLRERPNDPSPRIDYANTNRMDYPNIQAGATPAKVLIQGLDLYNVAATAGSYLKLYFGRATTSSVANVRAFNGNFIINSQYFSTTYNDSYIESLGLPSEPIANTVVFNRPVFYRATPSPFNETLRSADVTINNPTFLNDCWNGACSFLAGQVNADSKLRIQYDYTNTFKSGLTPIADVNVRFTRARQSVTGSPTWTVPNATVTATSNAQGTYTAVSLLDAYREGTSGTDLERFNWTAKARTHNRRSAAENIFTNRVFYQGTKNLSAGYSEEVQMLDLAFAPATLAAGLAITGVSFDSAGNCTLTANRTALEIFQAWCSASRNNLDMPDVWRYDGVTLTMGAANLSGTGTATGNFTTTGTITAPVTGTFTDVNNAGQIVVTGPAATDTVEMRKASDNSLISTRTGPGAFAVSPANVGVSVYFERKVGTVLVMSTQTTPVTLGTINEDVPMFAGPQVAVANVDGMAKEATLQALATANQTEHDATQSAIAALPVPLSSTQTQAAAAAALVAYDVVVPADLAALALEATAQAILQDTGTTGVVLANGAITSSVVANNALGNNAFTTGFYNQINGEVDAALADYDAPTKAELDAAQTAIVTAVNTRASQTSVDALGSPAQAAALATLASTNQSEHDATQAAIAAIPAGVTVAQIRADIERTGGMLDAVPTLPEMLASTLAKQSDLAGLATAANVTTAQTAIIGEINANEVKIDGIKAKTDGLTFTQAGVIDANIQYVNDVQVKGTGAPGDEWNPV